MMTIVVKTFEALSNQELYDLLQLRSAVFVVEQDCVYQDLDGKDINALHVLGFKNNNLVAYTRVFGPMAYFKQSSIGRVIVAKDERRHDYGNQIMNASIQAIKDHFNETKIRISAQCYLEKFYTNLGFESFGETYLEDGIPHVSMMKE